MEVMFLLLNWRQATQSARTWHDYPSKSVMHRGQTWHDYPWPWVSLTWLLYNLQLWRHRRWFRKFTVRFRPIRKEIVSSMYNNKQLLDDVFVISRIIKVEVGVMSRSRRLRLITLTETLIILDILKTESNNCFIIHWTKNKNGSHVFASSLTASNTKRANLTWLPLEVRHAPRSNMTWLPVTLSVFDMIIV